ncbi:MAG: VCBS repeat-containing protein [Planctomycetes bacterium]|nr:VCBS repeat-containing protein [Planctomycetota bacterium]
MQRAASLGVSLVALLASCGSDTPPPPTAPSGAQGSAQGGAQPKSGGARADEVAPRSTPPPVAIAERRTLFGDPQPAREAWDAENVARADPALDGWPLEAFALRAERQLRALVEHIWNEPLDTAALQALFAPDARVAAELRPAQLEQLFSDGNLHVQRGKPSAASRPVAELAALCEAARGAFGGARTRAVVQIDALELEGQDVWSSVRLDIAADVGRGALQQNARWRVLWSNPSDGSAPLVRELRVESFDEVSARVAAFGEHTARWIGSPPWLEREFLHGLEDFQGRQDRLTGSHLIGLHGLAIGDVNGDGLDDVYLCMQGGMANRLLLQRPDGTVVDGTNEAKLALLDNTRSALIVDIDSDGAQDVVAAVGPYVFIGFGDGHGVFNSQFLLGNAELGDEDVYSIAAADPDNDGDLDLYCCRYVMGGMISGVPRPYHDADNGASNIFWRNLGQRRFENATDAAGFGASNGKYSLAALWEDLDDDGDLDLYVANDFGRNNYFLNEDGRFRDVAAERGAEDMAASMGISSADFDLDGQLDLYVSNMDSSVGRRIVAQRDKFMQGQHPELNAHYARHARGNTLLRGLGKGMFEDVSERVGAMRAGWSWGGMFVDFDADGYEDLLVPNGFLSNHGAGDAESYFWRRVIGQSPADASESEAYRRAWVSLQHLVLENGVSYNGFERDTAFRNLRGREFVDVSSCAGFDFLDDTRAVALADWDDDGRVDAFVRARTAPRLRFLRNQDPSSNHFVALDLVGSTCHRDAIGARVTLECAGRTLTRTLHAGEGHLAQSSKRMTFGLGDAQRIEHLSVRWPDGTRSSFSDLAADTRYRIVQGASVPEVVPARNVRTFAEAEPQRMQPSPHAVERMLVVEKLPMSAFPAPSFADDARTLRAFAGAPVALVLWSVEDRNSLAWLEQLAERRTELDAAGVQLLLLSIDEGPSLGAAQRWAREHGLAERSGPADGAFRKLVQVLFIEVLGDSGGVDLPTTMLLDADGQWLVGYFGPLALATVVADAQAIGKLDTKARQTAKLAGGRWMLKSSRNWPLLIEVFRELGALEISEQMRAHAAAASEQR